MAAPYSTDLRDRVVARVLAGEAVRAVAAVFQLSPSTVVKWAQRFRSSGSAAPARMGGYKPRLLAAHRSFIVQRFVDEPELTLRGLQRELAERGVRVSYGAVWAFVHSEGLSFKKSPRARPNRTART